MNTLRLASNWLSRDRIGALLLIAIGAATALAGLSYRVGSLREMGAGFMPVALGLLLAFVGLLLLASHARASLGTVADASSSTREERNDGLRSVAIWRGPFFIVVSVVSFVVLGEIGGLVMASFGSIYLAALADRRNSQRDALALSCAGTAISVAVFHYALSLQMPLFGGNAL